MIRSEVGRAALATPGWPSETEGLRLFELAAEAAAHGPCMEVGGFGQRSALYLAEGCRQASGFPLFCVDAYRELDSGGDGPPGAGAWTVDALAHGARGVGLEEHVVALVTDPPVVSRFWPDDNASLLLVHGGAAPEDLERDVRLWAHIVRRGGYLCVRLPAGPPDAADAALRAVEAALPQDRWETVDRVGELGILRRRRSLIGVGARGANGANGHGANGNGHGAANGGGRVSSIVRGAASGRRVALASSRHLGEAPAVAGRGWSLLGQDGGQSIDLGDRTLFVFSDTLLALSGDGVPGREPGDRYAFLANTAAIATGHDLRAALAGARYLTDEAGVPRELISPTEEEAAQRLRFWPLHGVLVDGRVYLYYLIIYSEDLRSTWGFENRGVGLAIVDPDTGACERVTRNGDPCLWPNTVDDLHLGVQVLREGDLVYLYGSTRTGPGNDNQAVVGRVPVDRIADPDAYRFLAGSDWVVDPAEATPLGLCAPDYSVSFNPYVGAFTMIYVDGESKTLRMRTASSPAGPFSPSATIGTVSHHDSSELIYLAFEHPAFREEGGRVVHLTYSQPRFARNSLVRLRFR